MPGVDGTQQDLNRREGKGCFHGRLSIYSEFGVLPPAESGERPRYVHRHVDGRYGAAQDNLPRPRATTEALRSSFRAWTRTGLPPVERSQDAAALSLLKRRERQNAQACRSRQFLPALSVMSCRRRRSRGNSSELRESSTNLPRRTRAA